MLIVKVVGVNVKFSHDFSEYLKPIISLLRLHFKIETVRIFQFFSNFSNANNALMKPEKIF